MSWKQRILFLYVGICFSAGLVHAAEEQQILGNFKNPDAVKEVLSKKRSVANAAWWGFDKNDSTEAIQGAINSGAAKVIIPYMSADWIVRPIKLASNQKIYFEPGVVVTAKKGEFKGETDCLFSASEKDNITLQGYGATLRMRKEDYKSSMYLRSQHRHVLDIKGCQNVNIIGLHLKDSGGDGIFVGSTHDRPYPPCKNVLIQDCVCDNNYRQGISVISVIGLTVDNCMLNNTRGTLPASGIDLEPNNPEDRLRNVVISNCTAENNSGSGFIASISNLDIASGIVSILFVDCLAIRCQAPGFRVRAVNPARRPRGLIEFRNCTTVDAYYSGTSILWEKNSAIDIRFNNCKWRNVATRKDEIPIVIDVKDSGKSSRIEFTDCYLYDYKNREPVKVVNRTAAGRDAVSSLLNISGRINVYSPYSSKNGLNNHPEAINLEIIYRTPIDKK